MVNNSTLELLEKKFEDAVQSKLDAERVNDSDKIKEAEKAALAAREAVTATKTKQTEEITVTVSGGGNAKHRKMSDGKLVQTKRGIINDKERGARVNPDVVRTRRNVRQKVRERSRT